RRLELVTAECRSPAEGESLVGIHVEDRSVHAAQDLEGDVALAGDLERLLAPLEPLPPPAKAVAAGVPRVEELDVRVYRVVHARGERHGEVPPAAYQHAGSRGCDHALGLVGAVVQADLPEEAGRVEPGLWTAEQDGMASRGKRWAHHDRVARVPAE